MTAIQIRKCSAIESLFAPFLMRCRVPSQPVENSHALVIGDYRKNPAYPTWFKVKMYRRLNGHSNSGAPVVVFRRLEQIGVTLRFYNHAFIGSIGNPTGERSIR
jgi:hypothetical protein